MRQFTVLFFLLLLMQEAFTQENLLWYKQPATKWVEALPVGNGRMGAMVFGDPNHERIQLNEETIWAGTRVNDINPESKTHLKEIRQLLFDEKNAEAYTLIKKYMTGTPPQIRSYQTLGDLSFDWDSAGVTDYRRELDIAKAVHTTSFKKNNTTIKETVFIPAAENIILIRITSSIKGGLTGRIRLSRSADVTTTAKGKQLVMSGQINDVDDPAVKGPAGAHLKFAAIADVSMIDGNCTATGNTLQIEGATEIFVRFTAFSNYNQGKLNHDASIKPLDSCIKILTKAEERTYSQILTSHTTGWLTRFEKCILSLGEKDENRTAPPTDERLMAYRNGENDPGLIALYFQYGRYLLMASSLAPARLPANLQGKWNEHMDAPWQSDYHTNINLQMNYWPADITNTDNTYASLSAFMKSMMKPGMNCAKKMYGAGGWAMHHVTDIYGRTAINADPMWGTSPLAGAWMALNMYDHYAFTRDEAYLREYAWPLLKGSADFIMDFLVPDKEGHLVTAPSMSPENGFYLNKDSSIRHVVTYAPAIDIQIIRELFYNIRSVAGVIGIPSGYIKKMDDVEARLPPTAINRYGGIQEWIKDYDEEEPGHRHISQLFGLYPGTTLARDTALMTAARKTLEHRLANGGGHTGWSRAWIINFYARLKDGEQAGLHLDQLLKKSTLSNLFDTHPPFQIDGNFGGIAGIAEMLLQSHQGYIELLPALPGQWKKGNVKGLIARGNYNVSMQWSNGKLEKASIQSLNGLPMKVKYGTIEKSFDVKKGDRVELDGKLEPMK